MRPIPLFLLPHSVTLKQTGNADKWGDAEYTETTLKYVRVEPKQTLVYTKQNEKITLVAKLFIDAANSSIAGDTVRVDDKIVFNGMEYTVQTIETFYAFGASPHHWELGLV